MTVTKIEIRRDNDKVIIEAIFHRSGTKAWTHTLAQKRECEVCNKALEGGK